MLRREPGFYGLRRTRTFGNKGVAMAMLPEKPYQLALPRLAYEYEYSSALTAEDVTLSCVQPHS